jgi:hypothetical protein
MSQQATPEINGTTGTPDEVPVLNVDETKTPEVKTQEDNSASEAEDDQESEFSRKSVEDLGNAVRMTDTDEEAGLDLFCYVKCANTDSDFLKQCRGVVFNKETLVMKAFPYTAEYNHEELPRLEEVLRNFNDFTFYDAYEGALVRTFNFDGKWYLCTHRKLNAFRSKWASRESFGTQFKNALEAETTRNVPFKNSLPEGENILDRFYTTLDPSKQYMFLILNGEDNRIVCEPPPEPVVYHVGTFVDHELVLDEKINLPHPEKHTFLNIDELIHHVGNVDIRYGQGIICFGPDNTQLKVFHKDYQDLFRARGNEPSIKFRYLQVRMNKEFTNMLYYLYPKMGNTFDEYENHLYEIAQSIYKAYVQRFIKGNYVTVPKEEFQVVKECHSWHQEDRKTNRISLEKVIRVMNKQTPTCLNRMIRHFTTEKAKKKEDAKPPRAFESPAVNPSTNTPVLSPLLLARKKSKMPAPPKLDLQD